MVDDDNVKEVKDPKKKKEKKKSSSDNKPTKSKSDGKSKSKSKSSKDSKSSSKSNKDSDSGKTKSTDKKGKSSSKLDTTDKPQNDDNSNVETKEPATKFLPLSCGCCKSFVRVPASEPKFICPQCKVINYSLTHLEQSAKLKAELKKLYTKYDFKPFIKKVSCPRCIAQVWIPKKALIFECFDCGSINDSDGNRLGMKRNGFQSHGAVYGLNELMLSTPFLFWPFFFKSAIVK